MQPLSEIKQDDNRKGDNVGPQTYTVINPCHVSAKFSFGTGTRDSLKSKLITPAANNYEIKGNFDKVVEKPKVYTNSLIS
jgi:hypothetical protein